MPAGVVCVESPNPQEETDARCGARERRGTGGGPIDALAKLIAEHAR